MKVKPFRYSADNIGYLVYGIRDAVAIDAGGVDEMLAFANNQGLTIRVVTNTHAHHDHVSGNRMMLDRTGAEFLDPHAVLTRGTLAIDSEALEIFSTPGHTQDSVTFKADDCLITGDTLFNGTVGNCFSGDMKGFLASIRLLLSFPDQTRVYAGHDYVRDSMAFARSLEPENPHIHGFLAAYDPGHVVSTLADELKVNPYVRFNDPGMIRILKHRGLPVETEYERWTSIMALG